MKKNKIMHLCKLLGVMFITLSATIVFGYTNVYGEFNKLDSKSIASIVKDVKLDKEISNNASGAIASTNNTYIRRTNNSTVNTISGNSIRVGGVTKPLMKDNDGSHFYLTHNINGVYDGNGLPYVDYRTDFNTQKTLVYAHSSKSGNGPFQMLQNYHNNPGFYNNNKYITINYNGVTYNYLIFSVYVSTANSEQDEGLEYFHNIYYNSSDWANVLNKYKSRSEYETGVSVNSNDKILILQTCSMDNNYYERYYRYNLLVMGKLV